MIDAERTDAPLDAYDAVTDICGMKEISSVSRSVDRDAVGFGLTIDDQRNPCRLGQISQRIIPLPLPPTSSWFLSSRSKTTETASQPAGQQKAPEGTSLAWNGRDLQPASQVSERKTTEHEGTIIQSPNWTTSKQVIDPLRSHAMDPRRESDRASLHRSSGLDTKDLDAGRENGLDDGMSRGINERQTKTETTGTHGGNRKPATGTGVDGLAQE
ncbi:hypothetical protein B0H17DRAFT_1175704 [Mycena rosella]|uniref:Uncharacterized protein n=1 Tax=Mycena rosella TaxID=1033263 RepID=A0AAD7M6S0_MYCRO|nr:hypothetical protein B0H17DRAFT_1175704 [Mycena rosella]